MRRASYFKPVEMGVLYLGLWLGSCSQPEIPASLQPKNPSEIAPATASLKLAEEAHPGMPASAGAHDHVKADGPKPEDSAHPKGAEEAVDCHENSPPVVIYDGEKGSFFYCDKGTWKGVSPQEVASRSHNGLMKQVSGQKRKKKRTEHSCHKRETFHCTPGSEPDSYRCTRHILSNDPRLGR